MSLSLSYYRDFSGGLSELANDNMKDNQLSQAVNVIPGDGYGIQRSFGLKEALPQLPFPKEEMRMHWLLKIPRDGDVMTVAICNRREVQSRMFRLSSNGRSWSEIGQTSTTVRDWFVHAGCLYWFDGVNFYYYDGEARHEVTPTPTQGESLTEAEEAIWERIRGACSVEQRGKRFFYATRNNEIFFSEINDPTAVAPTSIININTRDYDQIYAIKEFRGGLLIFRRNSIFYLTGWDLAGGSDIQLTQLTAACGSRWPESVKSLNNGLVFFGERDLYRLYFNSSGNQILLENLSEGRISKAAPGISSLCVMRAEVWDDTYFLTMGNYDSVKEYRYYASSGAFFGPYTHGAWGYSLYNDMLYAGLNYGRIVSFDKESHCYMDPETGAETPIPVLAVSKGFCVGGAAGRQVRLKKVMVAMGQYQQESSRVTLRISGDYLEQAAEIGGNESLVLAEGSYGDAFWGWRDTVVKEIPVGKQTSYVRFTFADETVGEPLLIYGVGLLYHRKKAAGRRQGVIPAAVRYEE